jgi:hypothetical protein
MKENDFPEARKPLTNSQLTLVIIIGILKTSANHQAITAKKDNQSNYCRSQNSPKNKLANL